MKTYFVYCVFNEQNIDLSITKLTPKDDSFKIIYSSKDFLIIQSKNFPMMVNKKICNSKIKETYICDVIKTLMVILIDEKSQYFTRDTELETKLIESGLSLYQFCQVK